MLRPDAKDDLGANRSARRGAERDPKSEAVTSVGG